MSLSTELVGEVKSLENITIKSLHVAFDVVLSVFFKLPSLLLLESMVIVYTIVAGFVLIGVRSIFMAIAPGLAQQSTLVTDIVNLVLIFCQAAFEMLLAVTDFAGDIISAIDDISSVFGGPSIDKPRLGGNVDFSHMYTVSKSAVHDFLIEVVTTCGDYDKAWPVVYHGIKTATHAQACATVRFFTPIPWFADLINFFLAPFYDGSADPFNSHDSPGNCIDSLKDTSSISVMCSGLGAGYIVIEIFLPLLLAIIIVFACGEALFRALDLALTVALFGIRVADRLVIRRIAYPILVDVLEKV